MKNREGEETHQRGGEARKDRLKQTNYGSVIHATTETEKGARIRQETDSASVAGHSHSGRPLGNRKNVIYKNMWERQKDEKRKGCSKKLRALHHLQRGFLFGKKKKKKTGGCQRDCQRLGKRKERRRRFRLEESLLPRKKGRKTREGGPQRKTARKQIA